MLDTRPAPTRHAARRAVSPTGEERTFSADELIVSKTDPRGVITYANDVFLRVSGYAEEEVMGQPHNLIRHPEMPRGVFRLLWDALGARREIFAYINNLAADGAHYWVLAHVTPSYGADGRVTGYHSNRRLPAKGAIARIEAIYAQLRAEERRHGNARTAAEASLALLQDLVARHARGYDEFIWSIISAEEK